MYEIISKLLVTEVQPFLTKLIFSYKAPFVPSTKTAHGIIVASKIFHIRNQNPLLAPIENIEKAYDSMGCCVFLQSC